jgi:AcrR family transcriptional regulator
MGLINQEQRQRNRRAKRERKARILAAARRMFINLPFASVSFEDVARRAKVRDGLPTLYFGSKEDLFLQILGRDLRQWSEALPKDLEALPPDAGTAAAASVVTQSLADRPELTRLLSLLDQVLDQDADVEGSQGFAVTMGETIRRLGDDLETRVAGLQDGGGARFLFRLVALVSGLHPLTRPSGMAALAVRGMGAFEHGFDAELEPLAAALLELERA